MASSSSSQTTSGTSKPLLKMPVLAPSKFGDPKADSGSSVKPQFHGLKQSKLSALPIVAGAAKLESTSTPTNSTTATATATSSGFIPLSGSATTNSNPLAPAKLTVSVSSGEVKASSEKSDGEKVKAETESTPGADPASAPAPASAPTGPFVFGQDLHKRAENYKEDEESSRTNLKTEASSASSSGSFVFGQNLHKRAENFESIPASAASGTEDKKDVSEPAKEESKSPAKSLSEAAKEYSESRAPPKRKYEEIKTVTGEEEEENIIQIYAKLHVFNKDTSSWQERGRGQLRLNDDPRDKTSRIIMRTVGSLRVILNTTLFAGMSVEQPSEKAIRLTGTDENGEVKIFLIGAASKDVSPLFDALTSRVNDLRQSQSNGGSNNKSDEPPIKKSISDSPSAV